MNELVFNTEEYAITNSIIYLDAAASSDPETEVYVDMMMGLLHDWMNPSSSYEPAREVRRKVENAREQVRRFINAKDEDLIIFGSNASEMIGLALNNEKYKVISSEIDHPASFNGADYLISVNQYGQINLEHLSKLLDTQLFTEDWRNTPVFVTAHVNSEIGVLQDVNAIADIVHKHEQGIFVLDASQSAGHIPIDVQKLDVDMLVFTSEKMGCFRGTGVLYVRNKSSIDLYPLYHGGSQEVYRPGTENTQSIIALGNQCERIMKSFDERIATENKIYDQMYQAIIQACNGLCDVGFYPDYHSSQKDWSKDVNYVSNILSVIFKDIDNQQLLSMLDIYGVYCSAGSACSSWNRQPSRVLLGIGLTEEETMNVLRFSFDYGLENEEIEEFGRRLRKCLMSLKEVNLNE